MSNKWDKNTAPKGKGRGPAKFCFGYLDVARATKREVQTIRNDVHNGDLIPVDIVSMAKYVMKHRGKN